MGIVKSEMVKSAQPCRVGHRAAPAGGNAPQPQARIIEQNDAQAIVEITCACGDTFYLNCLCAAPTQTRRRTETAARNTEENSP